MSYFDIRCGVSSCMYQPIVHPTLSIMHNSNSAYILKILFMTNDVIKNMPISWSWMNPSNLMGNLHMTNLNSVQSWRRYRSITVHFSRAMLSKCLPSLVTLKSPRRRILSASGTFVLAVLSSLLKAITDSSELEHKQNRLSCNSNKAKGL